jgi:hypothetical protein
LRKLRAKLNLAADVKDEDVAEQAAALALADPPPDKGPEVVALSAKVKTLETERDTIKAEAETLKLSAAAPKEPDALSLSLITRAFKTDRERVIESGVVSEAGMKEIDALLLPAGKPAPFALALSAGSPDPLYSRLCDVLRRHPGVKTDAKVKREGVSLAAGPNHQSYDPDAKEPEKPITPERRTELLAHVGARPPPSKPNSTTRVQRNQPCSHRSTSHASTLETFALNMLQPIQRPEDARQDAMKFAASP